MNNAKKQRETIAWERLDMHTKKKNESKHNNKDCYQIGKQKRKGRKKAHKNPKQLRIQQ